MEFVSIHYAISYKRNGFETLRMMPSGSSHVAVDASKQIQRDLTVDIGKFNAICVAFEIKLRKIKKKVANLCCQYKARYKASYKNTTNRPIASFCTTWRKIQTGKRETWTRICVIALYNPNKSMQPNVGVTVVYRPHMLRGLHVGQIRRQNYLTLSRQFQSVSQSDNLKKCNLSGECSV